MVAKLFCKSRVETVRTLKIYDLEDKPFDRVEKGTKGRIMTFVFPPHIDPKVDVLFSDGRMFSIPQRWLREAR